MFDKREDRFWEIDALRGIAVLMMITFYAAFDIYFFGDIGLDIHRTMWWLLARITAAVFIVLVGVSLTLSLSRLGKVQKNEIIKKYLKRGLKIFSWGLLITGITWIFLRESFIIFGILHFIGISIILAVPFLERRYSNLLLGAILFLIGVILYTMEFDFSYLIWLGFQPEGLYTLDYFPLLPWFGVVLIGIFIGNMFYADFERKIDLPDLSQTPPFKQLAFLGKHSLLIYLIHQPLLLILLYGLGLISINLI
ncbi:MAG: heparan-alpha-glucosaminide N-acetyltransferase [Thermoplasmatota archaeon]